MTRAQEPTLELGGDADAQTWAPGGTCGRFRIDGVIGRGGMGVVLAGYDPDLDRKVAIKVLDRHGGDRDLRLAREAQAMARVRHPNVITVHEVGPVGDGVFLAMEHVEGQTLRAWLSAQPRSWQAIVEMFVGAGRGLAAIHAAGLVHRDFKIDNVMVTADGRPLVGDFGLATGDPEIGDIPDDAALAVTIAATGAAGGTPAVMAPEQWNRQAPDARSDQFAFAVSLWDALVGEPPFVGDDAAALRIAVVNGRRRPRRAVAAPTSILHVLDRALAIEPAQRWPELAALLAALERALTARRRNRAVAAAMGVVAVAVVSAWLYARSTRAAAPGCASAGDDIAATWSPAKQRWLADRLAAIPGSGPLVRLATTRVDGYVAALGRTATAACRATRVEHTASDTIFDLRMRCVERRRHELSVAIDALGRAADAAQLEASLDGLGALVDPASCGGDPERLAAEQDLPASPVDRQRALAIRDEVDQILAEQRAERPDGLADRARAAVARARELAHPPTLAPALAVLSHVLQRAGDHVAAEAVLHELVDVAATARLDREVARAWIQRGLVVGYELGKPHEGMPMFEAARAARLRAGDPLDLRVEQVRAETSVLAGAGQPRVAIEQLAQARQVVERALAEKSTAVNEETLADLWLDSADVAFFGDDFEGALAAYREAIARYQALFGPGTTSEAIARGNAAESLRALKRREEALTEQRAAAAIHQAHGSAGVARYAQVMSATADTLFALGRADEAFATYDQAIALMRSMPGVAANIQAGPYVGKALAQKNSRRYDEARVSFDAAVAVFAQANTRGTNLPVALYGRAEVASLRGDFAAAEVDYGAAAAEFVAQEGERSIRVSYALLGQGRALLELGRATEALPVLERGVTQDTRPVIHAQLVFYLARALTELEREPVRARQLVQEARTILTKHAGAGDATAAAALRLLDKWARRALR